MPESQAGPVATAPGETAEEAPSFGPRRCVKGSGPPDSQSWWGYFVAGRTLAIPESWHGEPAKPWTSSDSRGAYEPLSKRLPQHLSSLS